MTGQCIDSLRKDECPVCRGPFSRDHRPPTNISLVHVIDALAEDSDDAIFLCDKHNRALKSYFCLHCRVECCSDCVIGGDHRKHVEFVRRSDRLTGLELQKIKDEAQSLLSSMCDLDEKLQVIIQRLLHFLASCFLGLVHPGTRLSPIPN